MFLCVIRQHVRHKDFSGITRAAGARADAQELGESDFSLVAI
jgi:hypothetical protein